LNNKNKTASNKLFGGENLVFNWNKCVFAILILWCLQPVITAAAQIYHPVAGAFVSSLSFFLIGICADIICVLYLLNRITHEKSGFPIRIWKYQRWNVFLLAMLVWGGITVCLSDIKYITMFGTSYRLDGYLSYCIYAGFFGCAMILSNKDKLLKVLKCFVSVSVVLGITSLIAMIPFFSHTPNIYCISLRYMRGTSIFYNINHYGYYLVMAIICAMGLFIYEKSIIKSAAWLTAALFNIWVLIDNNTFGCYIAVFAGLVAFAFIFIAYEKSKKFNIKTIIPIISFVLLSACLLSFYNIGNNFFTLNEDISKFADEDEDTSTTGSGRWTLWVQTAELIKNRPVFGYGPEGLSGNLPRK
jgi:hypothetical protein